MHVIGDVHGCYLTLKEIIEKIGEDNVVYSVGDLVDKGPDTCKVLDYVMELPNFKMVLGNHEVKFITYMEEYIKNKDITKSLWYNNYGGRESIRSYEDLPWDERVLKIRKHLDFLKKQRYYFYLKDEKIFITHGFALPYFEKRFKITDKKVQTQYTCNRIEGKHFDVYDKKNQMLLKKKGVVNIFGHDAHKQVLSKESYIDIDTGCVYGGCLTAFNWRTNTLISVKCLDKVRKEKWEL